MSISESLEQLSLRQAQSPRGAYDISVRSLSSWPQSLDPSMSTRWDNISLALNSPATSIDRFPSPSKPFSDAGSSVSGESSSRRESLNRELDEEDNYSLSLPSCQSLLSRDEYPRYSYATGIGSLGPLGGKTDLREDAVYPRRQGLFPPQDLITEKLNSLRRIDNKNPLPPLEGLFEPRRDSEPKSMASLSVYSRFLSQAPHERTVPQNFQIQPYQQLSAVREVKKRRRRSPEKAHCNIKYLVEELDYIRYQRVDCAQQWPVVEAKFCKKFPLWVFPKQRAVQGLQGVNYRQNRCLPRLRNGQLVFMKNGHVDPVCTKTRDQIERRHLYTLVYLFPDRAMNYPWVTEADRQRAAELNVDRQRQLRDGRLSAKRRGTWVEELPPDSKCGCCPGKDRQRDAAKSSSAKRCSSE